MDADWADANFEHGVLRIALPKAETAEPKKIALNLNQQQVSGSGEKNGTRDREPAAS